MKIEIIKSDADNTVAEFFSSRPTPETDANVEDIGMGCQMVRLPNFRPQALRTTEKERDEARERYNELLGVEVTK
jgi:hypothetical protein